MMKSKKIQAKAEIKDFGIQKVITFWVDPNLSKEMVILLLLLRERLVNSLDLIFDNFSIYLKQNNNENKSVCNLFNNNKKIFKGAISINSLEFAISYLLKYYRDEMAEVEHIDLDFDYEKNTIVTLIIKTNLFKDISSDEMNKLLGL
ncbi:MAG: hypothetical protein SFU87_16135 [Chitinophagaceae bacterium]|nr:hypothetical protein [Chitinophagaceae bacterium]